MPRKNNKPWLAQLVAKDGAMHHLLVTSKRTELMKMPIRDNPLSSSPPDDQCPKRVYRFVRETTTGAPENHDNVLYGKKWFKTPTRLYIEE